MFFLFLIQAVLGNPAVIWKVSETPKALEANVLVEASNLMEYAQLIGLDKAQVLTYTQSQKDSLFQLEDFKDMVGRSHAYLFENLDHSYLDLSTYADLKAAAVPANSLTFHEQISDDSKTYILVHERNLRANAPKAHRHRITPGLLAAYLVGMLMISFLGTAVCCMLSVQSPDVFPKKGLVHAKEY